MTPPGSRRRGPVTADDRRDETLAAGTEQAGIEDLFEGLTEVSAAATSTDIGEFID